MKRYVCLTILLVLTGNFIFGQEGKKKRGDKNYTKFAYIKASELYQKLVEKGYESRDLYGKLADTYYFNARYREALPHYEKMLAYAGEVRPVYYYRYAQCLKSEGKYTEAEEALEEFYTLIGQPGGPEESLSDHIAEIESFSGRYDIADAGINTEYADFGAAFAGDSTVIFATARDTGIFVRRTHVWNKRPFLKLYSATINDEGNLEAPVKVEGKVNKKYHQSTPAVTRDGRTMYFTRNNFLKGKYRKAQNGTNHLKIYRATYRDGKWENIEDLSINNDEYSTAHPALSPDGKQLYFVSDRHGTRGNSDLFVADIRADGSFGPVQNLGDEINTAGRETFPFVSSSGELYFASDGHPGLGGLDIFTVRKDALGGNQVVNVGKPVNSAADDFAYIINEENKSGFFSSNRGQDSGFDNIYALLEKEPIALAAELCGHVRDSLTKEPLPGTQLTLYDENGRELKTLQTDSSGDFCLEVALRKNYNLRAEKAEYQIHEEFITGLKNGEKRELLIELNREDIVVTTGDDLTEKLGLKPIYFDFDGYRIREVSKIELGKVIEVMQQYPGISIDVRSHTDSRGSDSYNLQLSERRAKATVDYIVNTGEISRNRINGKGYGETQLVNECSNDVPCTAEQHQLNRRSEFVIIKM
ncbi:OmpA family protein [Sinomicrobium kalidii]|uniref:OmpA family protein n=1 Tax=Sinomicrobium kalidii TaxID=2900738 RepID=UPI001E4491DE|nr:OmpA family protein [Sinomicrobium kalidii]UGU15902.1 OmpA family protein [Sinomicrobium kalidii]